MDPHRCPGASAADNSFSLAREVERPLVGSIAALEMDRRYFRCIGTIE